MTPIESWEKEFEAMGSVQSGGCDGCSYNLDMIREIRAFIRTKLEEAYRKGRLDAVEYIKQAHTNSLDSRGETMLNTIGFQKVFDEAHAGGVSNQK